MPIPVSITLKSKVASPAVSTLDDIKILTPPLSVNFTAFPARLRRIWRNRPASPLKNCGISPLNSMRMEIPFSSTRSSSTSTTLSTSSFKSKGAFSKTSLPASILEKSRMSLMISKRASPDRLPVSEYNCCSLLSCVSSRRPNTPSTPFSGVRISWLIIARNCDFA